jgi:hypothetical protein
MMNGNITGSARNGKSSFVRTAAVIGVLGIFGAGGIALGAVIAKNSGPAPQSLFAQHAREAGLKACALGFPALGDILTNGTSYAAETSWNKQPPRATPSSRLSA